MHLPQGPKGPPLAPMGGPATGGQDHLTRKIGEVCKNLPGVLPMQCYSLANNAAAQVAQRITIRPFRGYSEPQQISYINDLWNAIATSHAFDFAT